MRKYFGVYGYQITHKMTLENVEIVPLYDDYSYVKKIACDQNCYHLTGIASFDVNGHLKEDIFDIEGILSFVDHFDIFIRNRIPEDEISQATEVIPREIYRMRRNNGGGSMIIPDAFSVPSRENFIRSIFLELKKNSNDEEIAFRQMFFKYIHTFRAQKMYIDVCYYLIFSGIEALARAHYKIYDNRKPISKLLANFINKFGYSFVDHDSKDNLFHSMSTYSHLRNALFHNGRFHKEVNINGEMVDLELKKFYSCFSKLISLVVLKYIKFDDGHVNWDSWISRRRHFNFAN